MFDFSVFLHIQISSAVHFGANRFEPLQSTSASTQCTTCKDLCQWLVYSMEICMLVQYVRTYVGLTLGLLVFVRLLAF